MCTASLFAQPAALSLSSGTTQPGGTVSLYLDIAWTGSRLPAGTQWTLVFSPSDVVAISVAPGPAAIAAAKTISCNGPVPGRYICLATGINTNLINNGVLAIVNITVSTTVSSTTIDLSDTLSATLDGEPYVTSGTGAVVTVVAAYTHITQSQIRLAPSCVNSTVTVCGQLAYAPQSGPTGFVWPLQAGTQVTLAQSVNVPISGPIAIADFGQFCSDCSSTPQYVGMHLYELIWCPSCNSVSWQPWTNPQGVQSFTPAVSPAGSDYYIWEEVR